jgi:NADH:ubiquinone oxidoreductase subunit 2 (subunit N)
MSMKARQPQLQPFLLQAPKMAAMGLFARVVHDAFGGVTADWQQVVAVLSVFSMFLGAVAAIGQKDIKRLMAYSSIAHMGFALMGLGRRHGVRRSSHVDLYGDLYLYEHRYVCPDPLYGA